MEPAQVRRASKWLTGIWAPACLIPRLVFPTGYLEDFFLRIHFSCVGWWRGICLYALGSGQAPLLSSRWSVRIKGVSKGDMQCLGSYSPRPKGWREAAVPGVWTESHIGGPFGRVGLGCRGYRPHIPLFLNFRFPARLPPDQIILKAEGEGASFPGQPPGTKSRSRKSREKLRGGMMEDQYSFNYEQSQLQMASPPKARW